MLSPTQSIKLKKSLITAAWALVEILSALNANSFAIVAADAIAVDIEINRFEQNIVEIDDAVLVGDGIEIVFFERDFVDGADARSLDEPENGMQIERSAKTASAAVARQFQRRPDIGFERDEFGMRRQPRIVRQRRRRFASVVGIEIAGKPRRFDFAVYAKCFFVADAARVDLHCPNRRRPRVKIAPYWAAEI